MKTIINNPSQIVVIGAGAGGMNTALSLAKLGHQVILIEARNHIGVPSEEMKDQKTMSTSWINPGRAGHGFHYIDLNTGKMLMESTIGLYRKYPHLPIGSTQVESHFLRKGRYFITKNSLFPKEKILEVYSQLREHYCLLVKKSPENEVLGKPDSFFRILEPCDYKEVVNIDEIAVGIETTEQLINPSLLAQTLLYEVKEEKNITLISGKKVIRVSYGQEKSFTVILENGHNISADYVINCAWENMEVIDQTLGFFDAAVKCTNRLKALAVVKLPAELQNQPSMFFCMGPFCMFSNLGDGTGLMTYAPMTNVANYSGLKIDETGIKFLSGNANSKEIEHYGKGIIAGVAHYIPAIKQAELLTVRFGVVKTYGDIDIFDPRSAVHSRDYFGVDSKQIGYIDNACMKLMNLIENAKLVEQLFGQHRITEGKIKILCNKITQELTVPFARSDRLKLFLNHHLRRHYSPHDFSSEEKFSRLKESYIRQVKIRKALVNELKYKSAYGIFFYLSLSKILPSFVVEIVIGYSKKTTHAKNQSLISNEWPLFIKKSRLGDSFGIHHSTKLIKSYSCSKF